MQLSWIKCKGDVWCNLNSVNLSHSHFDYMSGVYVIWHGGSNAATVRVGQGFIRDRLPEHRSDSEVQDFATLGLYVTWASVPESSRDGVEAYLAQVLKPKVGSRFPSVSPITVNLPW